MLLPFRIATGIGSFDWVVAAATTVPFPARYATCQRERTKSLARISEEGHATLRVVDATPMVRVSSTVTADEDLHSRYVPCGVVSAFNPSCGGGSWA